MCQSFQALHRPKSDMHHASAPPCEPPHFYRYASQSAPYSGFSNPAYRRPRTPASSTLSPEVPYSMNHTADVCIPDVSRDRLDPIGRLPNLLHALFNRLVRQIHMCHAVNPDEMTVFSHLSHQFLITRNIFPDQKKEAFTPLSRKPSSSFSCTPCAVRRRRSAPAPRWKSIPGRKPSGPPAPLPPNLPTASPLPACTRFLRNTDPAALPCTGRAVFLMEPLF